MDREFDPEFFEFMADLAANNDREWFAANKERYEAEVLEPALAFIEDFSYRLREISPNFVADPRRTGGSLFRIYRDTRFAKDKTPFKTHTGMQFRHVAGKDVHAPGFYLHLDPAESFAGGGLWRPDPSTANRVREKIARRPEGLAPRDARTAVLRAARGPRRAAQARPAGLRPRPRVRRGPAAQGLGRERFVRGRDGDDTRLPGRVHAPLRGPRAADALPLPGARPRVLRSAGLTSAGGPHRAPGS